MTVLVAWQPLLTDHQRHTLDALGHRLGNGPHYIVGREDDAERGRQGWTQVAAPRAVLPRRGWFTWALRRLTRDPNTIHIFSSPFEDPRLITILLVALVSRERVWLISEPWSDSSQSYFGKSSTIFDRLKALLRPIVYAIYGIVLKGRVEGIFAMSPLAIRQYRAVGIDKHRVHPFGYFVPLTAVGPNLHDHRELRCAFVGTLIARKGLADFATALHSFSAATGLPIIADVYGPGDPASVPAPLTYRGRIEFGKTSAALANYDLLIVPSRHDGWGVVVNEAIQAGTPVLASNRTGASAMIERWGCGAVFRAGDPEDLAIVLARIAADPALLAVMRAAAAVLAPLLTPAVAADYMAAAIAGRPIPNPWYDA